MSLPHPAIDQITLPNVLSALGDDTRLSIVGMLARNEGTSMTCGQFYELGSKTLLDVIAEQRRFIETQTGYIDALVNTYQARVEIERSAASPSLIKR